MAYSPSDFGLDKSGPQFAWLDIRLTVHGFPPTHLLDSLKSRVQRFQWKQGWTGSYADGIVGPTTLRRLTADPRPAPAPYAFDLTPWKLTLPVDENGDGKADEVTQPALATFEDAPWFVRGRDRLTFRAATDGARTSTNTSYARSELRERTADGKSNASWSNGDGRTHTLDMAGAFTHLPDGKPDCVIAQIHDASDDVIMIRLEGARLFVESRGKEVALLDSNYRLGTRFDLKIVADKTGIWVYYNGLGKRVLNEILTGMYFKAGCYTQASSLVDEDSDKYGTGYGETVIYKLEVDHV